MTKVSNIDPLATRESANGVAPLFVRRWSPRAMSGEPITDAELKRLLEAARWAPSGSNDQPWRIVYAMRGTPEWDALFAGLIEFNQLWTKNAAALFVFVSKQTMTTKEGPNDTASFDTGAAWMSLALQASMMDLVAHGMAGYDKGAIARAIRLPADHRIEAMAAIGRPGDIGVLPERMQKGETPSGRNPLEKFAFRGAMPG